MQSLPVALLSCVILCSVFTSLFCEPHDGKCESLVNGPFEICTTAGYNYTLPLPKKLTEPLKAELGQFLTTVIKSWHNCSKQSVAAAIECSFIIPKCSQGQRVYPCKRVCGELLKQCMNTTSTGMDGFGEIILDLMLSSCLSLPKEDPSSDKCFEPPNFTTNNSIPSPLDRGCQNLIFPACKNLGIYNHTLFSESVQKKVYKLYYNKTFNEDDLEQKFPKRVEEDLARFPKCRKNIEKLFCGEGFPPCFPEETSPMLKTLCRSVCNDIVKDCPGFFRGHFTDSEYCGMLAEGETSHGYCDRKEWPPPFTWLSYLPNPTTLPPTEPEKKKGPKGWVIAVSVVLTLAVVGITLAGLIWWKWQGRASGMGYTKQEDEKVTEE